jgi:hypothetical protein
VFVSVGVDDGDQPLSDPSNGYPTLFAILRFGAITIKKKWIVKDFGGVREGDAMFCEIRRVFTWIPFVWHHTHRWYSTAEQ